MRLLKIVPDNTNIDFVRLRGWAFGLTLLLSVLAVGLTVYRGLNFGVDFVGGLMIEEKFATTPDQNKVRSVVDSLGVGEAALQQQGGPQTLVIRLPVQNGADEGATNAVVKKVETALAQAFPGATFSRYSTVSGKVSGELVQHGILAVVLAVLGIGLFAIFRFEWQFGVSTIVAIVRALLHRQADRQCARIADLLDRRLADAQPVDHLPHPVLVGRGGEAFLDHQAADKVDAHVEAAREDQADRQDRQRQRQAERPFAQADEVDVGIVGDELEEFHGSARLRC